MILDQQLLLADAQTLVGSFTAADTTPVVSTNIIDTGARITSALTTANALPGWPNLNNGNTVTIGNDAGKSEVELLVQITTAVTSSGAATIKFQLCSSANSDLSSPTIITQTGLIALATMAAGYRFRISGDLPPGVDGRYVGVRYFIGTADTTGGAYTAGLLLDSNTQAI